MINTDLLKEIETGQPLCGSVYKEDVTNEDIRFIIYRYNGCNYYIEYKNDECINIINITTKKNK